jgi:hypothetical protein
MEWGSSERPIAPHGKRRRHRTIAGAIPSVELEKTGSYSAAAAIFGWAGFAPEASAPASDLAA